LTLRPPAGLLCSPPADPAARPLAISRSPLSQLKDPQSKVLYSQHRSPTGTYSFTAKIDGRYNYCFSNEMSTVSPKTLSSVPSLVTCQRRRSSQALTCWQTRLSTTRFNVHGVIYIPDDGQTAPIEKEIRLLADGLQDGPSPCRATHSLSDHRARLPGLTTDIPKQSRTSRSTLSSANAFIATVRIRSHRSPRLPLLLTLTPPQLASG
jgi:hypothetical protein